MGAYLVRRLLLAVTIVLAVSFGAFVGFGLSFDPAYQLLLGPGGYPRFLLVEHTYHLNEPILTRYWTWLSGLFHHGFGSTISTNVAGAPPRFESSGDPIWPQVWAASKITAEMVGGALVLIVLGSAFVGTVSAQRRRFRADVTTRVAAYLAAGIPAFLIGDLVRRAIVPHESFHFVPGRGYEATSTGSWFVVGPPTGGFVGWFQHMTLPIVALAIGFIGVYARYVRSSMIVSLHAPYVDVARGKGLPERRVVVRHALRNSLVPFTSLLSLEMGGVISAAIAVDAVFNTGGLASTFLGALSGSDPFFLTALLVMTAAIVSLFTIAGDVIVGMLDPRLRSSG